jgi:hypothetical protein
MEKHDPGARAPASSSNSAWGTAAVLVGCLAALAGAQAVGQQHSQDWGKAFQPRLQQVVTGSEQAARNYYQQKASPQLGFLTADTILGSSIKDLLTYLGYNEVSASDLHRLSSADLMAKGMPGEILATRFFAPKITAVAENAPAVPSSGFGWRALTRFKARENSPAVTNGVQSMYFLQNIFQPQADLDPFDPVKRVSKFNQVIVVRAGNGPFIDSKRAAYFFAYGPLIKLDGNGNPQQTADGKFTDDGPLAFKLAATFDGRDPETNLNAKDYFVPDACVQCHGGAQLKGKVNFLDTDHWFDRVLPTYGVDGDPYKTEDFVGLAKAKFGLLYDGGKDKPDDFKKAFDVLRKLNREIRDQNAAAGGTGNGNFQLRAADKWLQLHQDSADHVPPYQRGFGADAWKADNDNHKKLLYFLNRYCYRCHSSVRYSVYDRQAVKDRASDIAGRVTTVSDPLTWMPQDRAVPGLQPDGTAKGDLKVFLDLLDGLQQEN